MPPTPPNPNPTPEPTTATPASTTAAELDREVCREIASAIETVLARHYDRCRLVVSYGVVFDPPPDQTAFNSGIVGTAQRRPGGQLILASFALQAALAAIQGAVKNFDHAREEHLEEAAKAIQIIQEQFRAFQEKAGAATPPPGPQPPAAG